jgi:AraC family transcriptional activator of pobA
MLAGSTFTFVNPVDKKLAFSIEPFDNGERFTKLQHLGYSSVIWITRGQATLKVDFSEYELRAGQMMFFSPFQPFTFVDPQDIKGVMINFHPEFFCLFKQQNEISFCSIIFNNVYQSPFIDVNDKEAVSFGNLIEEMKAEFLNREAGQHDMIVSLLKVFFIRASRIRMNQTEETQVVLPDTKKPFILQNLKDAIDTHYREKHSANDYAELLHVTPKTLGRITKTHFNKTITDLIAERIVVEAKRLLYMTQRSVKEIAYDLGFNDEYYFSRYFKNITSVSPQTYRNAIGNVGVAV